MTGPIYICFGFELETYSTKFIFLKLLLSISQKRKEKKNKLKKTMTVAILLLSMVAFAAFPLSYTVEPTVPIAEEGDAYFVVFSGWELPANVEAIIEGCGGRVAHKFPNVGVLVAVPITDPATFEANLNRRPEIIDFGHDYVSEVPGDLVIVETEMESVPAVTDSCYWTYQWHQWHTIDASPTKAWSITTGSHDIKVAVLDTGIDYRHVDLAPNYDFALSRSFVDYYNGTTEDEMDYNGHGSWCGGMVAAPINGRGTVGVGPNLDLVNLKVMNRYGWGYFSWDFDAIYYAVEHGINVVSMSFGAYVPMAGGAKKDGAALFSALQRLFNYANRKGIVCIASAGNLGLDMDGLYSIRHLPSQCSNVICVIGTDIYDDIAHTAWGSNYGSCLHGISAPGGDYASTEPAWYRTEYPTKPKYPTWVYYYGLCFSTYLVIGGLNYYAWMGGTSMAAPHVAGVAGLLLSINPEFTPSQVKYFLRIGAENIGDPGYDEYFNFGLLNAYNSLLKAVMSNICRRLPVTTD